MGMSKHLNSSFKAAHEMATMFRGDKTGGENGMNNYVQLLERNAATGNDDAIRMLARIDRFRDASIPVEERRGLSEWFQHIRWLGLWGANASPVVIAEPSWAASVAMTKIPSEMYELVKAPWPAFLLRIPPQLGLVAHFHGMGEEPLTECGVGRWTSKTSTGESWEHWYISLTSAHKQPNGDQPIRSLAVCLDDLVGGKTEPGRGGEGAFGRTMRVLLPMIGAVCMAFNSAELSHKRSSKTCRQRGAEFPTREQWVVGKAVKLDLRLKVHDYIANGGGSERGPQTIQTLVRGHWKNQAHGAAGADRKFIHIEPYWRGPEDAPIAVRPHILGDNKSNDGPAASP